MARISRQLLRISVCLTGGVLALGVIVLAAVGSAVLTAALMVFRSAAPALESRPGPARPAPVPRAEPAL